MPKPVDDSQEVTLVPRVKGFTNQYITKGSYSDAEFKIKRLAVLIFNSEGNLAFSKEYNSSSVVLNKTMLNLNSATVVMFANVSLSDIKKQTIDAEGTSTWTDITTDTELTLEGLDGYSIDLGNNPVVLETELGGDAFNGFPMKGVASNVNLTPSASDAVEVNLQILYAKVNFEISVAEGTENQTLTEDGTSFTLSGYSVHNVSKITSVAELGEEDSTASDNYAYTGTSSKAGSLPSDANKLASTANSSKVAFTFYMAETCYNHGGTSGVYPVSDLPEEYKQQYKPKLATNGTGSPATGLATYVTINGKYKDYRGTEWTVNYKVYLGKNSYDDFHIDRNSEYKNILTIKGIRNNSGYGTDDVWIDHRVDVSTSDPSKHVKITRETLIDSHIEVRPLRVDLSGSNYVVAAIYLPSYPLDNEGRIINDINTPIVSWGQVQEVPGGNNENWIAIENNNGTIARGKLYCANGKRKYFTTSLIEELHLQNDSEGYGIKEDSQGHKYLQLSDGDCAWVYFDENLTSNKRRARIDVVFYKQDGSAVTESYDIYQAGLKTVGDYMIEEYEEYLHSYDSDDNYNLLTSPTDYTQTGLPWGMLIVNQSGELVGYKLSDNHVVKSIREGYDLLSERYDYYHSNDGSYYIFQKNDDASWSEVDKSTNTGLKFTARASKKDNMTIIDMGTRPTSAYQYCLSKNKFNESISDDKHSMMIHWYLPDVYEMKAILNATEADETLKDFAQGAYYWSSQPSFTTSLLQIADENDEYARAVSVNEITPTDIHRNEQHRIRCVRSSQGEYADMSERVPDGLGGLIKIPMTVKNEGFFDYDNWLKDLEKETIPYPAATSYRFPMGSSDPNSSKANSDFGGKTDDQGVHYYSKNPIDKKSWKSVVNDDWYSTIHESNWPGLTEYKVKNISVLGYSAVAELTNELKSIEKTEIIREGKIIDGIPENVSSVPLDHNEGSENLYITFGAGTNQSFEPLYEYYFEDASKANKIVWTKYWQVPTYTPDPSNGKEETFTGSKTTQTLAKVAQASKEAELERNGYEIITSEIVKGGYSFLDYPSSYYKIKACKNKYYYTAAGDWSEAKKTYDGAEQPKQAKDALTIYGGNTFTISAAEGYLIRSVKVNYKESNYIGTIVGVGRYLRLVDANKELPESNNPPANMTYSADGDQGWHKWTSSSEVGGVESVTLKLAAYTVSTSYNVIGVTIPSSYSYSEASDTRVYESDFETSIVIDSFEIRLEEVE